MLRNLILYWFYTTLRTLASKDLVRMLQGLMTNIIFPKLKRFYLSQKMKVLLDLWVGHFRSRLQLRNWNFYRNLVGKLNLILTISFKKKESYAIRESWRYQQANFTIIKVDKYVDTHVVRISEQTVSVNIYHFVLIQQNRPNFEIYDMKNLLERDWA